MDCSIYTKPASNSEKRCHCPRSRVGIVVSRRLGVVLVELVVICLIISLLLGVVAIDPIRRLERNKLDQDVNDFYLLLRTVAESAIMKRQIYEVVINMSEGTYVVYTAHKQPPESTEGGAESNVRSTPEDLDAEPVLPPGQLKRNIIAQADFDTGSNRIGGELILRADGQGWTESVLFQITDLNESYPRYIRCDRQTAQVTLSRKELTLPQPLKRL